MKIKDTNPDWIVTVEAIVKKEIVVSGCTEEQARNDPFRYATQERELGQSDYEVLTVTPNN